MYGKLITLAEQLLHAKADNPSQLAVDLFAFHVRDADTEASVFDLADYLYGALVLGIEA
jgi:hypothetical protein